TDNGPWLSYGDHAGSAAPLREGKGTMWEGGCRVPTVMWWPSKIPANTKCDELASTIDILPTVASLIDAELPDHKIDGKDIRPLLFAENGAQSPHEYFYHYYGGGQLQAVRDREWKLFFPHKYRTMAGKPGGTGGIPNKYSQASTGVELYNLKQDVSETKDVAAEHPEIVLRLKAAADVARAELGDKLTKKTGSGTRAIGRLGPGDKLLVD
ncbi:MAG: sulfatase/phosphatase domain-containing protein, partial [Planctomycetota bacterium]